MKYILHIMIIVILLNGGAIWAESIKLTMAYEDTTLPPFYLGEGERIPEKPGIAIELFKTG